MSEHPHQLQRKRMEPWMRLVLWAVFIVFGLPVIVTVVWSLLVVVLGVAAALVLR